MRDESAGRLEKEAGGFLKGVKSFLRTLSKVGPLRYPLHNGLFGYNQDIRKLETEYGDSSK
jgi:hypothetical protein